ncbi:MAG: Gfo/Idh/MocA family oxidoreductase [Syntrophaceae bacterium]|nr:Gfo/Idh/MocA family oxidoreductase [Syntrophaceae bacterium]
MPNDHKKIRVGVVGVGSMGQHHVRILNQINDVDFVGFHDLDSARSIQICEQYSCIAFDSLDELISNVDALTIAAPTSCHYDMAIKCLDSCKALLVEKPLAATVEQAEQIVELSHLNGVSLMVGHIERYNPAVAKLMELIKTEPEQIVTIEARRLNHFDGSRCMDVDVLYDLLIHDIDLALEIADSEIRSVSASGRPVFSKLNDIAYTRIEFINGATAILTTSKASPKKTRTISVTTPTRFFEADTIDRSLVVHRSENLTVDNTGACLMRDFHVEEINVENREPLRIEIEEFVKCARSSSKPIVDGYRALKAMKAIELVANSISSGQTIYF